MSQSEAVGIVLGAIVALSGAYYFFYEKLSKPRHEQQMEALRVQIHTNNELEKLNENLKSLIRSDEKQNATLNYLTKQYNDDEIRITTIENTYYLKDRQ